MRALRESDPADLIGEALRVLKRLAMPGTKLERRSDCFYALVGTRRAGRALHVPTATVEAFHRRDWLAGAGDGAFALSDVGLGWLKRTLAGEDPFLAQHGMLASAAIAGDDGGAKLVTVDEAESPVGRLRATNGPEGKPLIDEPQFLAGERLRRDFTLANLMPRLTVDLTAPVVAGRRGAGSSELSDIAVAARQRFSRALAALGPDLANVAVDVCCHLKEFNVAESTQDWPDSAALVVLKLALDRLADHYGFSATARNRTRTRAWRAPEEDGATDTERQAKKTARDPRA